MKIDFLDYPNSCPLSNPAAGIKMPKLGGPQKGLPGKNALPGIGKLAGRLLGEGLGVFPEP